MSAALSERQWRAATKWVAANEKQIREHGALKALEVMLVGTLGPAWEEEGWSVYRGSSVDSNVLREAIKMANQFGWTDLEVPKA